MDLLRPGSPRPDGDVGLNPRYTRTGYPGHFAAASLCQERPLLRRLWLGVSTVGLLLNAAWFTNWHFVS